MDYSLICAAAGTDLGRNLETIAQYLKYVGADDIRLFNTRDYLPNYPNLMAQPKGKIWDTWQNSISKCLSEANAHEGPAAIACHLTLYDPRTKVFHAPADPRVFTDAFEGRTIAPARVILFIDDVYDMFSRLSGDGDIFDAAQGSRDVQAMLTASSSRAATAVHSPSGSTTPASGIPLSGDAVSHLALMDYEVSSLQRLLAWRRSEMIAGETLAAQLQVPLYLLGIKHPLELLLPLLRGEVRNATYISHPITRHRQNNKETGEWSSDVTHLNRLPLELVRRGVVSIMPTAIDELRFAEPIAGDPFSRTRALSTRWPAMASDYGLIGFPARDHGFAAELKSEKQAFASAPAVASTYTRTLEAATYLEIPYRDHFLVNHCPNLLVFRPREGGNDFSGGVGQEIEFFTQLANTEGGRKMVLIHDSADVAAVLKRIYTEGPMDEGAASSAARGYVEAFAESKLNRNLISRDVTEIVRRGRLQHSQLSGRTASPRAEVELQLAAWETAALHVLYNEFTWLSEVPKWCLICVGDTSDTFILESAAAWLRGNTLCDSPLEMMKQALAQSGIAPEYETIRLAEHLATMNGAKLARI